MNLGPEEPFFDLRVVWGGGQGDRQPCALEICFPLMSGCGEPELDHLDEVDDGELSFPEHTENSLSGFPSFLGAIGSSSSVNKMC